MPSSPLLPFVRASSLHIGGAAAVASLRKDVVEDHGVDPRDVDAAFAVSRVTPGTNLLAFYALLGHRMGRWPLAAQAVLVGSFIPALIVVAVAIALSLSDARLVTAAMAGARAGGVAVICGAPMRLLQPQLRTHRATAALLAVGLFLIEWVAEVSPFVILLVAAVVGAAFLRSHDSAASPASFDS